MSSVMDDLEVWFVTGSQHLYGPEVLEQVAARRPGHRRLPRRAPRGPGPRRRASPSSSTPEAIAGTAPRRRPVGDLRRRHRLDAHVLAGQDVDRRPDRAPQAAGPSPHAVQPRPAVVVDRHGLHEPEPVGPRRPGVRVHPDPTATGPEDDRRPLGGPGRRRQARVVEPGRRRLARVAPAPDRPLRRQHARGRGHRGRQGRGPGAARLLGQRLRRRRPRRGRRGRRRRPTSTSWSRPTRGATTSRPALRRGGDRHDELRTAARIEAGLRRFLDDGGFGAFTDTFEDLGDAPPAARASASSG